MKEGTVSSKVFSPLKRLHVIDFHNTFQIFLEENYRSTMSILRFSLALISQGYKLLSTILFAHASHR